MLFESSGDDLGSLFGSSIFCSATSAAKFDGKPLLVQLLGHVVGSVTIGFN